MNLLKNLSIRAKLLLTFVAVCAVLGGVATFALKQIGTINESLNLLATRDVLGLHTCHEAAADLATMRRNVLYALVETKPEAIQAKGAEIDKAMAEFVEVCKQIEPTLCTVDGKATFATIKEDCPPYVAMSHEVVDLAQHGNRTQALEVLQKLRVLGNKLTDNLKKLCDAKMRVAEETARAGEETYRHAWITVVVSITTGVILSLVMGWLIARSIGVSLAKAIHVLKAMAGGDFTKHLAIDSKDEIGQMARAMNEATESVCGALKETRTVADALSAAAQQLAAAAEEISSGAQEQASSLEETASSLEEITSTVQQNADNAQQANQMSAAAREVAEKGGRVVGDAVRGMSEINTASKKIAEIITAIDEIAFQTNLLALNAAVEAARAGEQGRGFAVVAGEVRNLAQRSASAAKEIKGLIQDSVRKVETGADLVNQSGRTLEEIVSSVKRVTDIVGEIAAASREQSTGIDQVNKAVTQMDQVTQANAAQTEELSGTSQGLAEQAEQLQSLVARFNLDEATARRNPAKPATHTSPAPAAIAPRKTHAVKTVTKNTPKNLHSLDTAMSHASSADEGQQILDDLHEMDLVSAHAGTNGYGEFKEF